MTREVTSKHIVGITDLVVAAPIKEDFIDAYENATYETRLRVVAEALHNVRVSAREYEKLAPFSDPTQRIEMLLNFRIGILDQDLVQHRPKTGLTSRRYLFLAATFDGSLEEYMRRIWDPLGVFLDLLFCNCEGYKPAGDHGYIEYLKWVTSAQRDSAIFYSTTPLTVRDQIYLSDFERTQREMYSPKADLALARMTMPDLEAEAAADRSGPNAMTAHRLGLEALNILYRLADYYPPDRTDPTIKKGYVEADGEKGVVGNYTYAEGRYLLRAAHSLLKGWEPSKLPPQFRAPYEEQLRWFEGKGPNLPQHLVSQRKLSDDPEFDPSEVQAGIITSAGSPDRPVEDGALLLMTVTDPKQARQFIQSLPITYEGEAPSETGLYHSVAFTADGLKRLGLFDFKLNLFPKEFREGMARRSGLLGDMRDNHPRRWTLPERNWPPLDGSPALPRPPVEIGEVDFVIQIRHAPEPGKASDGAVLDEIRRLAAIKDSGVVLAAYEPMLSIYGKPGPKGEAGDTIGHFKLRDGISQPRPQPNLQEKERKPDDVRLGEILCGYRNDRGDEGSDTAPIKDLQRNGSFLVIRKLQQHVDDYFDYLERESRRIARDYGISFTASDLAARLLGRDPDGRSLVPAGPGGDNDFDFQKDANGDLCPHATHIRRSNPRAPFLDRPMPRIMRRGMSFGAPNSGPGTRRGVMFMAYGASIAEQFETIQRWVNGGNSTGVSAASNDPLVGVRPAKGNSVHRFVVGDQVIRTVMDRPFVTLDWGLYLFAPSRTGLSAIAGFLGPVPDIEAPRERRGRELLEQLQVMPEPLQRAEWKRILDDFDTKDPAERNRSPDIWSAIRLYHGGSYRLPFGQRLEERVKHEEGEGLAQASDGQDKESIVLVASYRHINEVLSTPGVFSVRIQGQRLNQTSGDIYVGMQPGTQYWEESIPTNEIMLAQSAEYGFATGYACAKEVLKGATDEAAKLGRPSFKIELRRDFLMPSLGAMCSQWFGVPDKQFMENGAWSWEKGERKARCPGDFLSPSRNAFYPNPSPALAQYAEEHGRKIQKAGADFVAQHQGKGTMPGTLSKLMEDKIASADVLARNIIGMMIGMLAPSDGNLRGILYEWLTEETLWRHQAALRRAANDGPATFEAANAAIYGPISRAMCKRPAPDLLFREATQPYVFSASSDGRDKSIEVRPGDVVIVGLVSASQRSLHDGSDGDPSIIFGGKRSAARQPDGEPTHACPAYRLMMGGMTGILAALLDVGQIKALPSSLIVEISNWKAPQPAP